jgi:hypothetical protein
MPEGADAHKPYGKMTATRIQNVARVLANSCYCRYWMHWNYPAREPNLMALCCINRDGTPADLLESDLVREGFRKETQDGLDYWIIERVDDEGRAWKPPF